MARGRLGDVKRYCPRCGARVAERAITCMMCGAALPTEGEEPGVSSPAAEEPAIIEQGPSAEKTCPQCGAPVAHRARKCMMCGASLAPPPRHRLFLQPVVLRVAVTLVVVLSVGLVAWKLFKPLINSQTASVGPTTVGLPMPTLTITGLPSPTATATRRATATSTSTPTPAAPITHTVRSGESFYSIAALYGTTPEAILAANGLSESYILHPGDVLIIPGGSPITLTPVALPVTITHQVQPGETLSGIAERYGVPIERLMEANGIEDPSLVQEGQELVIPLGTPTPTPMPTTTPGPTATPTPPYGAPILLAPPDGTIFGEDEVILLNWASVDILAADEWYVLRVQLVQDEDAQPAEVWTRATAWRMLPELHPPPGAKSRLFLWNVTVMRHTGTNLDGTWQGAPAGPSSPSRTFTWR
jgi:LysM repeat protein/ribosomal protein L40E